MANKSREESQSESETREQRLARLVDELVSNPDYVNGRRPYPRTVTAEDAADIAEEVWAQVDIATEKRAEHAKKQLLVIACHRSCNKCCEELVMVAWPEADALARFLMRPENSRAREGFLARYPEWREKIGTIDKELGDASARGDRDFYNNLYANQACNRVLCAFNEGGDCQVYAARPVVCRKAHALDTHLLCGPHPPEAGTLQAMKWEPFDQFVQTNLRLLWSVHHAIGGPKARPAALCERVYQKLKAAGFAGERA